jgi:hypothetical protein
MERWTDHDTAILELARLNIQANVMFDLGLLYAPDDIEGVTVALKALPLYRASRRKLRVRVIVEVSEAPAPVQANDC